MFAGLLFPLAVVGIWALVFVVSLLLFRLGMRERDAETAKLVQEEQESVQNAGWTFLTPLSP
jgi:hypothetical protein